MHLAAENDHIDTVRFLADRGAKLNLQNKARPTILQRPLRYQRHVTPQRPPRASFAPPIARRCANALSGV